MKISKSNLLQALSVVKPGLANKELLEQTTSFAFVEGRVVTYNDEISISHPVKEVDFEGAVNAKELYGLLSKIEKDEVELQVEDTELRIQSGRVKAGLKLEGEVKMPLKAAPEKMEKLSNPTRFKFLLTFAMQTCSKDPAQPKLSCVSLMQNGLITGSDGFRLIQGQGDPIPVKDFLLPASSAVEIVKIDPTFISLEKGWAHFKNAQGTVVSSRRLEDDYMPPDQIQNILTFNKGGKFEFPSRITDILERVRLFSTSDTPLEEIIEVLIEGGKITLKAVSEMTGSWVEEKASIAFDGSIDFLIVPSLLIDILQVTKEALVDKSLTKIKFSAADWEYIVMLRNRPTTKTKDKKKK